jgi:hypothetical protein
MKQYKQCQNHTQLIWNKKTQGIILASLWGCTKFALKISFTHHQASSCSNKNYKIEFVNLSWEQIDKKRGHQTIVNSKYKPHPS